MKMPAPRLSQTIEQRTWENGQLRNELAYHQRKHAASVYLLEEVRVVVESLHQALANFQRLNEDTEDVVAGRKCQRVERSGRGWQGPLARGTVA
jgi:hypothetical protein